MGLGINQGKAGNAMAFKKRRGLRVQVLKRKGRIKLRKKIKIKTKRKMKRKINNSKLKVRKARTRTRTRQNKIRKTRKIKYVKPKSIQKKQSENITVMDSNLLAPSNLHGKVKVCMLVIQHPFVDARIFKKEAKSLLKAGYDVTLVVPRNKKGFLYDIEGTSYTNKFLEKKFVYEGIKIVTYQPVVPSFDYMKNAVHSGNFKAFKDPLYLAGLAEKADIYHVHEVFSLYSGIGIKRTLKSMYGKSVKLIYDSHEITEGSEQYVSLFKQMIKETDSVITVSDSMKDWYKRAFPLLPVEVIYNSPHLDNDFEPKKYTSKGLVAGFIGWMTKEKANKDKMLKITELCRKHMDFKFKILGGVRGSKIDFPDSMKNYIIQCGWVKFERIPQHLKDVDIGWIDFDMNTPVHPLNYRVALPNKFFSFLNSGIPILVNNCSEMANFVRYNQCGLVVDGENPSAEDYEKAILYLQTHRRKLVEMSKNARRIMVETYSWEHMENRMVQLYENLCKVQL